MIVTDIEMETPVVHTMEQSQYNSSAKYNTGKVEIVIRVICTVSLVLGTAT